MLILLSQVDASLFHFWPLTTTTTTDINKVYTHRRGHDGLLDAPFPMLAAARVLAGAHAAHAPVPQPARRGLFARRQVVHGRALASAAHRPLGA